MKQELFTQARRISPEEQNHRAKIQDMQREIRELKNSITAKRMDLGRRQEKQKANGVETGERKVTEALKRELVQPFRDRIKYLEKKIIREKEKETGLNKSMQQQKNLFK